MCLKRVIIFFAVFASVSVLHLSANIKDDSQRKILCRSCIDTKNTSCIAATCGYIDQNSTSEVMNGTVLEDMVDDDDYLLPPTLYCQDEGILTFLWNFTQNTSYFLEYSNGNGERNYTELTSKAYQVISDLQADTRYSVQLISVFFTADQVTLRRSPQLSILTLKPSRTPLPVRKIYMDALTLVNGKYKALIKWDVASDKSCYYDIVWYSGEDMGDYRQIEINNPLSLHEVNISGLSLGENYLVEIRAISEGIEERMESSQVSFSISVPSCLDSYKSLERCIPEAPTNLTIREVFVHANANVNDPVYDLKLSWDKPVLTPDYYIAHIIDHMRNNSIYLNITGDSTSATCNNIKLGTYYHVSLVAYSKKGPSSPTTIYRYVNGTTTALVLGNSWISTELILIVVCPLIIVGLVVMLLLNHFVGKKIRNNYFKDPGQKLLTTVNYIITESNRQEEPDKWEIQPGKLFIHAILGEGAFGVVRKGTLSTENENSVEVAIKMLRSNPTPDELRQFFQEIDIMKSVPHHPHLVSLIGCITRDTNSGPLLVVEYCSKGDLQTYLRSAWDKWTNQSVIEGSQSAAPDPTGCATNKLYNLNTVLTETDLPQPKDLISFARQIVLGMEHLTSLKLIHRDLAARNILVCADNVVKISDFGLSRDVYHDKVYCKTTGGKLPIRWMALESMTHQVYTAQSDVWSFGILLWEIVTLGSTPYPGVSTQDLLPLLKSGYRMEKPSNCSDELYAIMCNCWKASPRERPTFSDLRNLLEGLLERVSHYLHLNLIESTDISIYKKPDHRYKNIHFSEGYVQQLKGV